MRSLKSRPLWGLLTTLAGILFVTGAASHVGDNHHFRHPLHRNHAAHRALPKAPSIRPTLCLAHCQPAIRHSGTYATGALAGHSAGDLYGFMLGHTGVVPARLYVNWDNNIAKMWDRKVAHHPGKKVARDTGNTLVTEYHTSFSGTMSLADYQWRVAQAAKHVHASLKWQPLCSSYFKKLQTARRCMLLKRVMDNLYGRSLIADSETELLPSRTNGAFNRDFYDFVLRNAGRRFLESVPAIHDGLTSYGPFQFTSHALSDAHARQEGASKINLFLPRSQRIPGSVMLLRGDDHAKAAYMFGVANLASLIKSLNERELRTFERVASSRALDIVEFVATAHNKPAVARRAARAWLDHDARYPYLVSLPSVSRIYAMKTEANYNALSRTRG